MALNMNKNAPRTSSNDNWKASGFLNMFIPKQTGARYKLGALALRASKPMEAALDQWCNDNPGLVGQLPAKFQLEYVSASAKDTSALDIFNDDMPNVRVAPVDRDPSKAVGYLNFYVPTTGEPAKIGVIPLKGDQIEEARIAKWLDQDVERGVRLLEKLIVEYRPAVNSGGGAPALAL